MLIIIILIIFAFIYKFSKYIKLKESEKELQEIEILESEKNNKIRAIQEEIVKINNNFLLESATLSKRIDDLKSMESNLKNNVEYLKLKRDKKKKEINELKQSYINPKHLHIYYQRIVQDIKVDFDKNNSHLLVKKLNVMIKNEEFYNKFSSSANEIYHKLKHDKDIMDTFYELKNAILLSDVYYLNSISHKELTSILEEFIVQFDFEDELKTFFIRVLKDNISNILNVFEEIDIINKLHKEKKHINVKYYDVDLKLIKQIKSNTNFEITFIEDPNILGGFILENQFYRYDISLLNEIQKLEKVIIQKGVTIDNQKYK